MKSTLKILGMGILTLSALSPLAFSKGEGEKTKVVDLNQVDLEQVEDNWDNSNASAPINPNHGMKIKDIVEPTNEYTYASFGKPDPFAFPNFNARSGAAEAEEASGPGGGLSSNEIAIINPLQNYPIEALTVKGVWQHADGEMRAAIVTPKNEGVVVKSGDPISSGKVIKIEKESLVVRLYRIRKDGVREYDDKRMSFGQPTHPDKGTIRLAPGKVAQFPGMEAPADQAAKVDAATVPPPGTAAAPNPKTPRPGAQAVAPKAPIVGIPGGIGDPGFGAPQANNAAAQAAAAAAAALSQSQGGNPNNAVPVTDKPPASTRPGAN